MKYIGLIAILLIAAALAGAGCLGEERPPATPLPTTATPELTTIATPVPTSDIDPVQTLPSAQQIYLDLAKDRVYSDITLTYNGGGGEMFTNSIEMRVTRSDGQVIDQFMNNGAKPKRGDTLVIRGTRGSDRCEVYVTSAGIRYKVIDESLELGGFYGY